MKKRVCYSEMAYVLGMVFLAFGTALMEKGGFGMSVVVAPAYILHLKVSQFLPFFSFGMAEYVLQAVLIVLLSLVLQTFKKHYLFSFITAVIYGFLLDGMMKAVSFMPESFLIRICLYVAGFVICAIGVAFLFHTYIAPEAYELVVKEVSHEKKMEIGKVKTIYDLSSCFISVLLSFLFFGLFRFEGVKTGTFICAVFNGWLIGKMGNLLERMLDFKDGSDLRKYMDQ